MNQGATNSQLIATCPAYQVTDDMCDLVEFAAAQLETGDLLTPEMLLSLTGFVWLDTPFEAYPNKPGSEEEAVSSVNVLVWAPTDRDAGGKKVKLGIQVSLFVLRNNSEVKRLHAMPRLAKYTESEWNDFLPNLFLVSSYYYPVGESDVHRVLGNIPNVEELISVTKWLIAFGVISRSTAATNTPAVMPRQARRQATHKGINYGLHVIGLKRRESAGNGTRAVDWQQRWVVRGGWRRQPYGPREEGKTRLQWISAYVKGPADKPLIIQDKLWKL